MNNNYRVRLLALMVGCGLILGELALVNHLHIGASEASPPAVQQPQRPRASVARDALRLAACAHGDVPSRVQAQVRS